MPPLRRYYLLGCCFLALTGICGEVLAQVTALSGSKDYSMRVWQMEDGLPQNGVTAVLQTHDGYLWVATYGGLVRFDGVRFTSFTGGNTPALQNSRVTALFEDADGVLWIGHETGDISRFVGGHFQPPSSVDRRLRESVLGIGADANGKVWLLHQGGALASSSGAEVLEPTEEERRVSGGVAMARNNRGQLWVSRGGFVSELRSNKLERMQFEASGGEYVAWIAASKDGGLWMVRNGRIRKWHDGVWAEDWGISPSRQSFVTALLELNDGSLALGTLDQGLFLLTRGEPVQHFNRANGLPHDWVRCLSEDREGNLWVGAGSSGLLVLRPARVKTVNAPDNWQGRAVLSVAAARDGSLWIGTEGAGLYHFQEGNWTRYAEKEGLANPFVWSVAEDARGGLWVGTWGGGIWTRDRESFIRPGGLNGFAAPVTALLPGKANGEMWAGTGSGVMHYQDGMAAWLEKGEGTSLSDVRAVAEGPEGILWFGMFGGGLGRMQGSDWRQFGKNDGLPSDFVQCLLAADDGALWVGTADGGLARYKNGRFAVINTRHGLPSNVICHIADDGRGYFWLSSHGGIVRVSKDELNRCAGGGANSVHCLVYGRSDGMPTLECSGGLQPAGCRTPDGRLWFTTSKGLVVVNPEKVWQNPLPPPVVIEDMTVDDAATEIAAGSPKPLRIPPGRQRFEFRYAGLSYSAPEKVRFKYRLEGLEPAWVNAGSERVATYSYLPPGNYTFRVVACNNDGVWNEAGAALSFVVLPFFWQTWWFASFAGIVTIGLAWVVAAQVARKRLRHELERVEREQDIERERSRIARDIHDDLGASLTRITMLSQTARSELANPERAAAELDRIYGTARELTRAMEEIVWAVNPRHDSLDSLAGYLGKFAQDFLGGAGIRCRLEIPVQLPAWPLSADIRHNVFLAFKEALNNTVKHSGASETRITLALESSAFRLVIEDDGCGFLPPAAGAGDAAVVESKLTGNGLVNMRRRLEGVAGRCEIQSWPGKGTQVSFWVAVKV